MVVSYLTESFFRSLLDPNNIGALFNRGAIFLQQSAFDSALIDYDLIIDSHPDDPKAYCNRGNVYLGKSDLGRAIQDFSQAILLDRKESCAHYNRGMAWLRLSQWDAARADFLAAEQMGVDVVSEFNQDHISVPDFERTNDLKMPKDIADMLSTKEKQTT